MAKRDFTGKFRKTGLLLSLIALFGASVVFRILSLEGAVITAAEAADPEPLGTMAGPTAPIRAAIDEVEALRDRLQARESALDDRERAISAAQALVEERLSELEAAEERLESLIQISDAAAETDITQLTEVYQSMDPGEAAALFAQMEPSFAAGFLTRMPPQASASILAQLDPEIAYAISVIIATRNAGAPRRANPAPDTES